MIMRDTFEWFDEETKAKISYPIQWSNMLKEPKWIVLDLPVMKYFICIHNGKRLRLYRYGKAETVEGDLGRSWKWRICLLKAE